jgi:hypothetical protein
MVVALSFALFVLGGLVLGAALAIALSRLPHARSYDDDAAAVLDMLCATAVCAIAVWIATSWALAFAGMLRALPLTAAAVLEIAIGLGWLYRSRSTRARSYRMMEHGTLAATIVALAPVALWIAFVTWRGTVLPPYNHDALSYHLPKAVLLMRAEGYRFFDVPEPRTATWPCNYEILLSDSMILTRGDHLTAVFSTFSYAVVALFAARTAAAWWGGGTHVALVSALVATAPVIVLHSGLHKNDLLFSVLAMGAFAWAARWYSTGCTASALLAVLALLLGLGTKLSAALVLPPVGALLAAGAIRHPTVARRSRVALVCAGASVLSFLLGSGIYIDNVRHVHKLFLSPPQPRGYGAWSNIWEFTSMLAISPFARRGAAAWNVFHHEYWWWPRNDVWVSDWGAIVSLLAFALIPCIWRYRTQGLRAERAATCVAAAFTYIFTLPIHVVPPGLYNSFVRYTLFVVPLVAAWTVSPLLLELERHAAKWAPSRFASILLRVAPACGVAAFGVRTLDKFGLQDAYAPLVFVAHVLDHPDDRIPFVRRNRAAYVVDLLAADTDTCAFDVGFDTWVYPAYGSAWTRDVEFQQPTTSDVVIPEQANWVAVDRSWHVFFGHPGFVDMGKWYLLGRGKPTDEDVKVYRQLLRDPRFELVYDDREQNQAVFHRKVQ